MSVQENSLKNLVNITENVSEEDFKKNGQKGGIASGKARRKKKEMRELICDILDMNIKPGKAEDFKNLADSKGKNISVSQALILAQVKRAMAGDTRALEFLRDTAGMKPVDKSEVQASIRDNGKIDEIINALNS